MIPVQASSTLPTLVASRHHHHHCTRPRIATPSPRFSRHNDLTLPSPTRTRQRAAAVTSIHSGEQSPPLITVNTNEHVHTPPPACGHANLEICAQRLLHATAHIACRFDTPPPSLDVDNNNRNPIASDAITTAPLTCATYKSHPGVSNFREQTDRHHRTYPPTHAPQSTRPPPTPPNARTNPR